MSERPDLIPQMPKIHDAVGVTADGVEVFATDEERRKDEYIYSALYWGGRDRLGELTRTVMDPVSGLEIIGQTVIDQGVEITNLGDDLEVTSGIALSASAAIASNSANMLVFNPMFLDDGDGWALTGDWVIAAGGQTLGGSGFAARCVSSGDSNTIRNTGGRFPVAEGERLYAQAMILREAGISSGGGRVNIRWLDAAGANLSVSSGNTISTGTDSWQQSRAVANAPAGAAYGQIEAQAVTLTGAIRASGFAGARLPKDADLPGIGAAQATATTALNATATTNGKLSATWMVTLDVNGKVSGVKAYNDGATSEFDFLADVFKISNPSGAGTVTPFRVEGGVVFIDNARIDGLAVGQHAFNALDSVGWTGRAGSTSTTSATMTNISGLSGLTRVTDASGILIIDVNFAEIWNGSSNQQGFAQIVVNGTPRIGHLIYDTNDSGVRKCARMRCAVAVGIGTHTIDVQWQTLGGTLNLTGGDVMVDFRKGASFSGLTGDSGSSGGGSGSGGGNWDAIP